ncbi:hypothetical protein LptCag_1601 [Leptospirillum ferriphilum]|uniref:Uncharacterized protein n=1 Tax=Leptospirillum ferriphilum TaxID=178606 RepID=A0A094YKY5_9BACT|nr:hypothetical protein [Leptospirillum ferriphilum]KGA93891.1 hypothetical protein LptCag_1601 [Leptospirillum ferriphilum]
MEKQFKRVFLVVITAATLAIGAQPEPSSGNPFATVDTWKSEKAKIPDPEKEVRLNVRMIDLKNGDQVKVTTLGSQKGGPIYRRYEWNGHVIGLAWTGAKWFPSLDKMAMILAPFLPEQIVGEKKSRFVLVVDWTKKNIAGRMYLPQTFPPGFSPEEVR